jgi:hypothetical protein
MVIYNFDKVARVKLLLTAGSANKNVQLRTIFNNYRSTFYDSFITDFNEKTQNLPNDLLIATVIYMPLPGSNASTCKFEIKGPSLYNLFKKFNFLHIYWNTGLLFFKVSLFNLYKLVNLKYSLNVGLLNLNLKKILFTFFNSFYSYSVNKKNLLFTIRYIEGSNFTYYNIQLFSRFYKSFFKLY